MKQMRKSFFILCAGIIVAFSACSKNDEQPAMDANPEQGTVAVQFDLQVSSLPAPSRAAGDAFIPSRYVVEVFKGADATGVRDQHIEYGTTAQSIILEKGQEYTFLFWADKGTPGTTAQNYADSQGDYNVNSLKSISVSASNKQPAYEAFCTTTTFTVKSHDESSDDYTIILKRAVAKVIYKQADEDFTNEGNTLTVKYPAAQTLDVSTNVVTELPSSSFTHTFTNIAKASAGEELGGSYVFAPAEESEITDLEITFNDEPLRTISNIPVQRNRKTVITGAYSNLYGTTFTVSPEVEDWTDDDYTMALPHGVNIGGVVWAEGNIILKDGKLAFGAPNSTGLYFKWGSLIGMTGNSAGSTSFAAGNNIAFVPQGCTLTINSYNTVPYADETTFAVGRAEDVFKTYNTSGFNAVTGKGDICRYMSNQSGWQYGKWRLPTSMELETLSENNTNNTLYGSWSTDLANQKKDINKDGNFAVLTGYFVGAKVIDPNDGMTVAPPVGTIYLPASGMRNGSNSGNLVNMGNYGGTWTCSATINTEAYRLLFSSMFLQPARTSVRVDGQTIRCVRDK